MLTTWIVLLFAAMMAISVAVDLVHWAQQLSTDTSHDVAARTRKLLFAPYPLDNRRFDAEPPAA